MATEAEEKEQTTAEPVVEKPAEPEQKPKKPPKPPKQREILLPILTILFVLVGIAALVRNRIRRVPGLTGPPGL